VSSDNAVPGRTVTLAWYYSRTPVTRTLKGNEKQFKLAGFKLSGSIEYSIFHVNNGPFPSCLVPLFQSKSWCIAFHMKMSFHSHTDKTHFHMKGFAGGLALKKSYKTIRKWPVDSLLLFQHFSIQYSAN